MTTHKDEEAKLCDEFEAWCKANSLPHISAGELILRDDLLDQEHVDWLEDFLDRWEAWERRGRGVDFESYQARYDIDPRDA
jgi:hypothetical protein